MQKRTAMRLYYRNCGLTVDRHIGILHDARLRQKPGACGSKLPRRLLTIPPTGQVLSETSLIASRQLNSRTRPTRIDERYSKGHHLPSSDVGSRSVIDWGRLIPDSDVTGFISKRRCRKCGLSQRQSTVAMLQPRKHSCFVRLY